MNILIIEDDIYLGGKMCEVFEKNILTNRIKVVRSYVDFLDELDHISGYDIVLIDIILEDTSKKTGIDILRLIRKKTLELPIVITSSISTYDSLENAFYIGANDYLIKPFRLRELEIRVMKWFHSYIFHSHFSLNKEISYYELVYNISKNKYFFMGREISLTKRSKYVLSLFLIHPEKLLTEKVLREKIWGDYEAKTGSNNIRVYILRLKGKLQEFGIDSWIHNVRGEGYILEKSS